MNNRTLLPAALAAIILPLSALAETATVDGIMWTYSVWGGTASIYKSSTPCGRRSSGEGANFNSPLTFLLQFGIIPLLAYGVLPA